MSENQRTLGLEDTFHFSCNLGIDCFTRCCENVNILLTPYDIIQMKNRLGISATEFLEKYTRRLLAPKTFFPAVQFKMNEENKKRCYFVGANGCGIYEQRPWSCRMYPLDHSAEAGIFEPMVDSTRCLGLQDKAAWQLRDWFRDQGLEPYTDWNHRFAELTQDEQVMNWRKGHPGGVDIFYLACYDVDGFREVVFKEKLFEMLEQPPVDRDTLQTDDLALLEFAFTWLRTVAERGVANL